MIDPEDRATRDLFDGTERGSINRPLWLRPKVTVLDGSRRTTRFRDPMDEAQAARLRGQTEQ